MTHVQANVGQWMLKYVLKVSLYKFKGMDYKI